MEYVTIGTATFSAGPSTVTVPETVTELFFTFHYPGVTLSQLFTDGNTATLVYYF
jgi:hypothetical protein